MLVPATGLAAVLLAFAGAHAQDASGAVPPGPGGGPMMMLRGTTLAISASGEVKATPDMATISLGVQTDAPTAAEAMSQNAAQMTRIVETLKRSGVADKDIKTSGLSLNAQFDYQPNKPPRLNGYQASNQVTVLVYDLARLGATLDAVVASGANEINGVGFGLKDPGAAEDAARLKAVQTLQARAQLYAGATGLHLGQLINLTEGEAVAPPRPIPLMAMRANAAVAATTPVEAGQLDIRIDVSGLYELTK
jgi:uncharacterized protein YggE